VSIRRSTMLHLRSGGLRAAAGGGKPPCPARARPFQMDSSETDKQARFHMFRA